MSPHRRIGAVAAHAPGPGGGTCSKKMHHRDGETVRRRVGGAVGAKNLLTVSVSLWCNCLAMPPHRRIGAVAAHAPGPGGGTCSQKMHHRDGETGRRRVGGAVGAKNLLTVSVSLWCNCLAMSPHRRIGAWRDCRKKICHRDGETVRRRVGGAAGAKNLLTVSVSLWCNCLAMSPHRRIGAWRDCRKKMHHRDGETVRRRVGGAAGAKNLLTVSVSLWCNCLAMPPHRRTGIRAHHDAAAAKRRSSRRFHSSTMTSTDTTSSVASAAPRGQSSEARNSS